MSGFTYVMADIHGLMDKFMMMLEKIELKEEDHVYILGDVIDRGKDGIALLQYLLNRPEQFTLFMGNHEHMMLEQLREEAGLPISNLYTSHVREIWNQNHNSKTKADFFSLSKEKQEEIFSYLNTLPVALTNLEVKGHIFYLGHALPGLFKEEGYQNYLDHFNQEERLLWSRVESYELNQIKVKVGKSLKEEVTFIGGHTPTFHYGCPGKIFYEGQTIENSLYINLDCGCALGEKEGVLGCLRLDDFKEFYVH